MEELYCIICNRLGCKLWCDDCINKHKKFYYFYLSENSLRKRYHEGINSLYELRDVIFVVFKILLYDMRPVSSGLLRVSFKVISRFNDNDINNMIVMIFNKLHDYKLDCPCYDEIKKNIIKYIY